MVSWGKLLARIYSWFEIIYLLLVPCLEHVDPLADRSCEVEGNTTTLIQTQTEEKSAETARRFSSRVTDQRNLLSPWNFRSQFNVFRIPNFLMTNASRLVFLASPIIINSSFISIFTLINFFQIQRRCFHGNRLKKTVWKVSRNLYYMFSKMWNLVY